MVEAIAEAGIPRVLLDTNVVLDVVLARAPWDADAVVLLDGIARGELEGFIAGHAVTTVYYLVERAAGRQLAATAVTDVLKILKVVALETTDFYAALALGLKDFEDGVQVAACLKAGADFLITRNEKDFRGTVVPLRSPGAMIAALHGQRDA